MRPMLAALVLVLVAACPVARGQDAPPDPEWLGTAQDAFTRARKESKVVLVCFDGDDPASTGLRAGVFATARFKEWATRNAVLVEFGTHAQSRTRSVVVGEAAEVLTRFGVKVAPTALFLTADQVELGRIEGYATAPAVWIDKAISFGGDKANGIHPAAPRSAKHLVLVLLVLVALGALGVLVKWPAIQRRLKAPTKDLAGPG